MTIQSSLECFEMVESFFYYFTIYFSDMGNQKNELNRMCLFMTSKLE